MSGKCNACETCKPRGPTKHKHEEHCDQTYRNQFSHEFCQRYSLSKPSYHPPGVFLKSEPTLTHKVRSTTDAGSKPPVTLALKRRAIPIACNNLTKMDWFHSLPFQQFQALLTLFSKSFSPFPHGTCLLSVSNQYLALDEIYHPICAPIPRNVTLRTPTVHLGLMDGRRDSHPH